MQGFVAPLVSASYRNSCGNHDDIRLGFGFSNDIAGFFGDVGIGCYAMIAAPLSAAVHNGAGVSQKSQNRQTPIAGEITSNRKARIFL